MVAVRVEGVNDQLAVGILAPPDGNRREVGTKTIQQRSVDESAFQERYFHYTTILESEALVLVPPQNANLQIRNAMFTTRRYWDPKL